MKKIIFISIVSFAFSTANLFSQTTSVKKDTLAWYTDIAKAQELSKATNKPIFAFFTGSDWCGWCHKLQNEVFSKPEFVQWANKNVILLMLDFPRRKQLAPELTQQNNSLAQTFHVQGFPTCWIFFMTKVDSTNNFNIAALGSLGYPSGAIPGKEEVKFISNANDILANKKTP